MVQIIVLATSDFGVALEKYLRVHEFETLVLPQATTPTETILHIRKNGAILGGILELDGRNGIESWLDVFHDLDKMTLVITRARGGELEKEVDKFSGWGTAVLPNDPHYHVIYLETVLYWRNRKETYYHFLPPAKASRLSSEKRTINGTYGRHELSGKSTSCYSSVQKVPLPQRIVLPSIRQKETSVPPAQAETSPHKRTPTTHFYGRSVKLGRREKDILALFENNVEHVLTIDFIMGKCHLKSQAYTFVVVSNLRKALERAELGLGKVIVTIKGKGYQYFPPKA